jgi:hypothetical protein
LTDPANEPSAGSATSEVDAGFAMSVEEITAIWAKTIDTQMHFNEMATKSRQLGLAFATAALGVAVVLLGQGDDFAIVVFGFKLHATVLVLAAAIIAIWAVEQLDMVYHQMLRGAVAFGEDFEQVHMSKLLKLEKGLTQAISHYSRSADPSASGSPKKYAGSPSVTAGGKVKAFYRRTMIVLGIGMGAILVVTNFEGWHTPKEASPATATTKVENEAGPLEALDTVENAASGTEGAQASANSEDASK